MNFGSKKHEVIPGVGNGARFALSALVCLALVTPPATASGILSGKTDPPSLAPAVEIRAQQRLAGSGRADVATPSILAGGNLVISYRNFGSSGQMVRRLGYPVANAATETIGQIRDIYRRLEPPGFGGWVGRLTPVTSGRLNALTAFCRSIETESVPHEEARTLSLNDLKSGVGLPNGFVFRYMKTNYYSMTDRATGREYIVYGDPHFGRNAANPEGTHYGDWTSSAIVTVLPKASLSERVFTFARSTGGDARNGFGLPTDLYIITDRIAIQVHGLNSESPTGAISHDPMFVYRSLASEINAAPILYWDGSVGELRFASGDRPAPPAGAQEYGRVQPETARDADNSLQHGAFVFDVPDEPGLQRNEVEFRASFAQALSALSNPLPSVRDAGRAHVDGAKPVARENAAFADKFGSIVAELKGIQSRLEQIADKVLDDGIALTEIETLKAESELLRTREVELATKIRQMPATPRIK